MNRYFWGWMLNWKISLFSWKRVLDVNAAMCDLPCTKLIWTHPNSLLTAIRLAHSLSPEIFSLARGEIRCCRLICRDTVTVRTQRRPQGGSQFVFCLCLVAASFDKRWAVGQVEWSCFTDKSPGLLHISDVCIQLDLQDRTDWDAQNFGCTLCCGF